jgi:hypothetical protein
MRYSHRNPLIYIAIDAEQHPGTCVRLHLILNDTRRHSKFAGSSTPATGKREQQSTATSGLEAADSHHSDIASLTSK